MRAFRKLAMLLILPTAAATVAMPGTAVAAQGRHHRHAQFVRLVGNGSHVTVRHSVLRSGRVTFSVRSTNAGGESDITLFRPKRGHTLNEVFADLAEEFSQDPQTAARGTRHLVRDVLTYGLADVSPARGALVTRTLRPGKYYLMDLGNPPQSGPPATTTLMVKRHTGYRAAALRAHARATVRMTSTDRFRVRRTLPAHGTIRVSNVSDTLHFMAMQRVKRGTTDRQIQQFFNSGGNGQGPFLQSPTMGADVLTPGQSLKLTYRLHRGTYVLMCFVADDKTGMPHALMGMHKVVHLR